MGGLQPSVIHAGLWHGANGANHMWQLLHPDCRMRALCTCALCYGLSLHRTCVHVCSPPGFTTSHAYAFMSTRTHSMNMHPRVRMCARLTCTHMQAHAHTSMCSHMRTPYMYTHARTHICTLICVCVLAQTGNFGSLAPASSSPSPFRALNA